jgi:hypothetical protein
MTCGALAAAVWLGPGGIIAASIVVAMAATWLTWRNRAPEERVIARTATVDLGEQAFVQLASACGLTDEDRAVVRALARAHGEAAPAALLISGDAFDAARQRLPRTATADLRLGARTLRERLFGGRA